MKKNLFKMLSIILSIAMLASMLVIPTFAINSLMDIPVKAGCYMTIETNKHSLKYMPGDDVIMTVRLHDASGKQISAPYIRYNLRVDGSNDAGYGEYQLYWTTVPFTDGEYTIRTKAIDIPGFMRLRVDILDENKTVIKRGYTASEGDWTAFGPSGQLSFFQGGIVVDADNIRTTAATLSGTQVGSYEGVTYDEYGVPSDFMSFWDSALAELDMAGNEPKLIELAQIPTTTYSNWYRYNHDLYSFKVSCPGDPTDLKSGETYVAGTIQIPKNVDLASAPIEMWYCGYGITLPGAQGSDSVKGKIAVTVAAHSLDYDFVNKIQPTSDAFNLHADQQGSTNYYGFSFSENQNREYVYFKYMLLRDIQAIRFVTKAFRSGGGVEFDASADETTRTLASEKLTAGLWDGENISSNGSSQGAFQAVAVAALYSETVGEKEQRITNLWAGIPWMCDVQGNTDTLKVQSTYRQHYNSKQSGTDGEAVGLNYYDTANFGRYVQCDTTISAGMGDPLCPASGVSALYNNIRTNGTDKNITLGFIQGKTHSTNDNSNKHTEEKIYTYKSVERPVGYTDAAGNFEADISDGVLSVWSLGDDKILTGTEGDAFVTYLADYASSITGIKIIGKFAEIGDTQFMFGALKNATSVQIDYRTDTIGAYNTTDYPGNFIGMSKLVTFGHVEFDQAGNVVEGSRHNTYEEGICDLRGFDYVVNHTGSSGYNALPRCIFRSTGVKNVIMPDSLMCGGVDVAGKLPVNGFALCQSLTEVTVPATVRVSELGQYFVWKSSKVRTIRFEGGVADSFTVGGYGTGGGNYPTNQGVEACVIYCPSSADADKVNAALTAIGVPDTSIKAAVLENIGFTVEGSVLTVPFNGDSGIAACDAAWYGAMGGITEVIIEDGYSYLGASIFDMTTVERIHIPESVTSISSECFGGRTDFTVVGVPGSYAETFAESYGISFEMNATKDNVIASDGILVKIAENNTIGSSVAIRFIFKWDAAATEIVGTPVKVGVVACSADYYSQAEGADENAKLIALLADTNTAKVKKNDIAAYDEGKMTLRGKFLADKTDASKGIYGYSYTLYDIPSNHYDSEIYAATYIKWDDGSYTVVSNSYEDASSATKNTISLYDVTLGLFKRGLINSEKVEDRYLWDVIKGFAGEDTNTLSANKVEYFFLPDNIAGGYVLAYRSTLDWRTDSANIAKSVMPNPSWSDANLATKQAKYSEVKAIVVDYGVGGTKLNRVFNSYNMASKSNIETVVYPSEFKFRDSSANGYIFLDNPKLKNVIWCHTDANGDYVEHMSDITWADDVTDRSSLADLRGFGSTFGYTQSFNNTAIVNIVISSDATVGTVPTGKVIWQEITN